MRRAFPEPSRNSPHAGVLSRAEFDAAAARSEAEWAAAPGGLLQLALQGGGGGEGDGGAEAAAERDEGVTRVEACAAPLKGGQGGGEGGARTP